MKENPKSENNIESIGRCSPYLKHDKTGINHDRLPNLRQSLATIDEHSIIPLIKH